MDKLYTALDCILQDVTDFEAIRRAVGRYRTCGDAHYLEVIEKACDTAIREIKELSIKLQAAEKEGN